MDRLKNRLSIKSDLTRALLAEFMGTALLLIVVCGVVAQSVLSKGRVNEMININVGVGLAVAFGIAICAKISGGHINPGVSFMFMIFGQLSPLRFVLYSLAQTAGAFFGAAFASLVYCNAINDFDGGVRQVFGPKATAGIYASYPGAHLGALNGLIDQIIGMAVFCFLIAHITDRRNSYPKYMQPLLIGLSFTMIGTAYGLNCGYPLNPARDFGPRLFTLIAGYGGEVFSFRNYGWFWVPLVGPMIGAALGGLLYIITIGFHTPYDQDDVEIRKYELVTSDETKPLTTGEKMAAVIVADR